MPPTRRPTPPETLLFAALCAFAVATLVNAVREDTKARNAAKVARLKIRRDAKLNQIDRVMWEHPMSYEGN